MAGKTLMLLCCLVAAARGGAQSSDAASAIVVTSEQQAGVASDALPATVRAPARQGSLCSARGAGFDFQARRRRAAVLQIA